MTRDEARDYMHEHGTEIFERDKSGKGWICPICESGSGPHGTGITSKDGVHFTCWAGCFTNCDVIDIIGQIENITEYPAKLEAAARRFGITIDGNKRPTPIARKRTGEDMTKAKEEGAAMTADDVQLFLLEAERHLEETDYHRGISLETLRRFHVGFVPEWRHPKTPKSVPTSPRLIIPVGADSYIARDTRSNLTEEQEKYKKQLVGSRGRAIFNGDALKKATGPIFITEGELDAMSIIDVGGEAITAGSAANWQWVLEAIKANPPDHPAILAFDNDGPGSENGRKLKIALGKEGILFGDYTPPNGAKDANEALMKDRAAFAASVQAAVDRASSLQAKNELLPVSAYLPDFVEILKNARHSVCYSTGFAELDDIFNGGFRPALYVLGAISSLGKTSLALQFADNVAQSGNDVIFVSLEMARAELVAKSLSRLTYQIANERHSRKRAGELALTTVNILGGDCNDDERLLEAALTTYRKQCADHLFILEGADVCGITQVRYWVERHIMATGRKPFIIVDYLQILTPDDSNGADKKNTDQLIKGLKHISRDFDVPILAISSFNRENYSNPVSMVAFKETGSIEYSADVLIGLQHHFMGYKDGESDKERAVRLRQAYKGAAENAAKGYRQQIEAVVLKNRNGRKGSVVLGFTAKFNYYDADASADGEYKELAHSRKCLSF